jgi:hypothetical protein
MIFIVGHNFLTDIQSQIVLVAWLKHHLPYFSDSAYERWLEDIFWPTWERIQPSIQKVRDRKNARRRERRREKKMKTQNARRKSTLKWRILDALKQHPMTTVLLAARLSAHPKAVDGHLSRMTKRGELVKLGRGLYALPGTVQNIPPEPVQAVSSNKTSEPITLEDIADGVAEWKEPPVLEFSDYYAVEVPDDEGVCDPPNLKTAEARWSQNGIYSAMI